MNTKNDKITKLIKTETNAYMVKKTITCLVAILIILAFMIGSFYFWLYNTNVELIYLMAYYAVVGLPFAGLTIITAVDINKKRYDATTNYINRKINFYKKYNLA